MAPFYSISGPTLSTSNVTTYTNAATLYIANAPTAGGSATITNPYAVYVAAGATYLGGALTATGAILHNTTTNSQSYTTTGAGTITISSGTAGSINNMTIGGTTAAAGTFTSVTNSGLTSGRVVYSTTGGLATDSANLTFNGTTLTANTIGAFTLSGTIAGGGNQINNVVIGTATPLAGSFTAIKGTGLGISGSSIPTAANQTTLDFLSGTGGRLLAWGANATTPGTLYLGCISSDAVLGSTAYITLDGTGNFSGISSMGTTISSKTAQFNAAGGSIYASFADGTKTWRIGTGIQSAGTFSLYNSTDAVNAFTVDATGKVGIGTNSPAYKLEVSGGASAGLMAVSTTSASAGSAIKLIGSTSAYKNWQISNSYAAVNGALEFTPSTANGGTTFSTPAMLIDSGGAVGIGTTAPSTYVANGGLALSGLYGTSSAAFSIYNSSASSASNIAKIDFKVNNTFSNGSPCAAIFALNPDAAGNNAGALVLATSANGTNSTPTEAVRIDSSQRVGIGASTTAQLRSQLTVLGAGQATAALQDSGNADGTIQINSNVNAGGRGGALTFGALLDNATYTPFVAIKALLANGANNGQGSLAFSYRVATSDATLTEGMRLNYDGNVGIGTSSPSNKLVISNAGAAGFEFDPTNGNMQTYNRSGAAYTATNILASSINFKTGTSPALSMLLDSSGNAVIGGTDASGFRLKVQFTGTNGLRLDTTSTSATLCVQFVYNASTEVGKISTTTTSTSYGTSSDYRLKESVQPMTGALAKVAALKPVTYKWKSNGFDGEGFIAHELAEVCPDAVTGEKDAVDENGNIKPQGIDTSFLVATLTAAIQEQQALITSLTARIEALER